jgi:hypothetical protein
MSARAVTVNEVLDGHVVLDIECLDRVYLNAYVPILQSSGQVVAFMTQYLDLPIPSPALFDKIGQKFRRSVASFEALIADNLDLGRPANVELIFNRHIRRDTPGAAGNKVSRAGQSKIYRTRPSRRCRGGRRLWQV